MAAPTIEEAIANGIKDLTYKDNRLGIVQSFRGSVIFNHGFRRWAAIDHAAVIVNGKVVQNGYIEFEQMAPETEAEKRARLAKEDKSFFGKLRSIF